MTTQFNTNQFRFIKDHRVLLGNIIELVDGYLGGFPSTMEIKSDHTGKVVRFVVDEEAAIRNEFWDGEMCEYISNDTNTRVVLIRG